MSTPGYTHLDLYSPEVEHHIRTRGTLWTRQGSFVKARRARPGERVATTTPRGLVETIRTLDRTDVVITNVTGDQYAIDAETFARRYKPTGRAGRYVGVGLAIIAPNPLDTPITVDAPWGVTQRAAADCLIAVAGPDDRYLIDSVSFASTYREADEPRDSYLAEWVPKQDEEKS